MGDFRADIKIQFTMFGKTYKMDSYVNYWPDSDYDGVDQRVVDFFRESWEDAKNRHDEIVWKAQEKDREEETKKNELQELKRLREKYESRE